MESVLGRYRNLIILVCVLFLQVLGLATQVKRSGNDEEHTRLIRIWVVGAVTPFERGLVWIQNGTGGLWHNYFYLRGVRAENRELKQQIEQMRLEQVRLAEDAAQARRLQTLLAFKEQFISRTVAAQVIGSSGSDHSRIIYIDKGENAGIRRDMAVMTANGIVGKVLLVYPSVAQVLLINDESSGVGALLEKTRLQGVLRGAANGEVMLERVMSDEQVPVGETVLTSGGDQIFPKGLPVGTVDKVGNGKDLFLNIKVRPAANLSKLEEVLVLVEKQERQQTAEDSTRMRAADILAQRLPSVPEKPAADANAVGVTVPGTKPASATTEAKPAGTAASLNAKISSGASVAQKAPLAGQPAKATGVASSGQKSPSTNAAAPGAAKPVPSQTKTDNAPKKPAKPASTPPTTPSAAQTSPTAVPQSSPPNSQRPANESSPQ